jgi:hypothetical protein
MSGPRLPRASLAVLSFVHALAFGASAALLPWPTFTVFALLAGLLAALHLATAVLAAIGSGMRGVAWRAASLLALGFFAYFTYATLGSGLYVNLLYDGVGRAILAAAIAAWCVGTLFTLPLALWGIASTGGLLRFRSRREREHKALLSVGIVVLAGFGVAATAGGARGNRPLGVSTTIDERDILPLAAVTPKRKVAAPQTFVFAPTSCEKPPARFEGATVFLSFVALVDGSPEPILVCIQRAALEAAVTAAREELEARWDRGVATVDVVVRTRTLPEAGPLLGAVVVRPGFEGVCEKDKCLLPWQLFGLDAFTEAANVAALQAELGVTASSLRRRLGVADGGFKGLDALETRTFWLRGDGNVEPVRHLRTGPRPLSEAELRAGIADAIGYVAANQEPDGRFRYMVDPFSGTITNANFSVPRQAGTTLALCELAEHSKEALPAAKRSLAMLADLEQQKGDRGGIVHPKGAKKKAALGPTALSTVAFFACRPVTGDRHDDTMVRLATLLLAMQRDDGGFSPAWDPETGVVVAGRDPLYAAGQAVLSLVLWEASDLPKPAGLAEAIDRAMRYYAGPYWDIPLRDFFYLEENWHCLAARAALQTHRNDAYERFCVDYMTMKTRFIQRPESGIDEDLVGAYAFGHVFPPHHTATAGYGEALAAVIDIKRARGLDTTRDEETMRLVVEYLLRHQWRPDNCAMCTQKVRVVGAFSENFASPAIRIDFVQHAMAAMHHGGTVLGVLRGAE